MKLARTRLAAQFGLFALTNALTAYSAFAQDVATSGQVAAGQSVTTGQAATPGFAEIMIQMLPMFVAVFFVFHLLVTRPQQQKLKEQQDLLSALKRGDSVVTSGGLFGRISAIEKDHVLLEIAQNVRVKCSLSAISKREDQKSDASKSNKE